jgi:EamA domain-containing membrane protein RarD
MMDLSTILGAPPGAFFGMTVLLFGGAAMSTGRALARSWRPVWQVVPYCLLLGFGDRFLLFALFEGELLSASGYLIVALILVAFGLLAYRLTLARLMVRQYPWLYEPAGRLGWRERG